MVKKFSMLALAGLIALPAMASASGGANAKDLERKIEELSVQLDQLKAQMAEKGEGVSQTDFNNLADTVGGMEERSDSWDLAARIKFYGDFRTRLDYYSADGISGQTYSNDTLWTNRFRMNMRVKATENLEFKARLAMYKAWGMQTTPGGVGSDYPMWDGNMTRQPADSALRVDRAFVSWKEIGGLPIWLSVGRRPTTDGPPAQIRMGTDERMGTSTAYMDWPFDGIAAGYAYRWGMEAMGTGKVRFCYGRGFEDGLEAEDGTEGYLSDTDFTGLSWDVMQKGDRFLTLQSFMAFNAFNYPTFESEYINAYLAPTQDQRGNIWHTSGVYQDKIGAVNFFGSAGWSQTNPDSYGMFNDLMSASANTEDENGYSVYLGARYDIDSIGLKLGLEWNYGSEYWIGLTPGHDDIYQSKLAARGNVIEVYGIYDLPTGEAISQYAKTFVRFGYQHYEYDYTGSMDWNIRPYDLDDANDIATLQTLELDAVESADQIYLTFEAYF